ncbi:MAG: hypothetical protein HUK40_05745 [Desulfobacter sp.]|nr:hypothetical protein [Desulfobacter sp.]WDP84987.1 MAG: hypothetical protein HUN05_07370 [Desulfobacter sp.]
MCDEALKYWHSSEQEYAPSRTKEYEALLKELEDEILQTVLDFSTD